MWIVGLSSFVLQTQVPPKMSKESQEIMRALTSFGAELKEMRKDVAELKEMRKDVGVLTEDVGVLTEDVGVLTEDVAELKRNSNGGSVSFTHASLNSETLIDKMICALKFPFLLSLPRTGLWVDIGCAIFWLLAHKVFGTVVWYLINTFIFKVGWSKEEKRHTKKHVKLALHAVGVVGTVVLFHHRAVFRAWYRSLSAGAGRVLVRPEAKETDYLLGTT
jgi:hypothetical protein